jgi:hypothetical protein
MKSIEELFVLHRARSGLFSEYEPGEVAYVGNGLGDNAVVGFVTPLSGDKVFRFLAVVVSAFCEATVQAPPFVACGRAGNGLVVLEPRVPMKAGQLAFVAAYINQAVRWRFNWYRQVTVDRIKRLMIASGAPSDMRFRVRAALPASANAGRGAWSADFCAFSLESLFDLHGGDYHALNALEPGDVPVVSCGDQDNGIAGYFRVEEHLYEGKLTIALNGATLSAKYHPYVFAAKDDVAVCFPRQPLRLTTLLFVQVMLNRERWRYSYYRKCYLDKLRRFQVALPRVGHSIDENTIEDLVTTTPYWSYLERQLRTATREREDPRIR